MKRWNDKMRPFELIEVDKQAHKMMAAWVLCLLNSRDLDPAERLRLTSEVVEGGIFEYLYRLIITDIKPPVFYRIKDNPEHYRLLTHWVLEQLSPRLTPLGEDFPSRMAAFFLEDSEDRLTRRILNAAHLYASYSEFTLLKGVNDPDEELLDIEQGFLNAIRGYQDLEGMSELMAPETSVLGRFLRMCGRLRFQKRWSQTPRIPETSVLGHLHIVACFAWLFCLELDASPTRRNNAFFAGLFHDLPELLTRDIISPVKRSAQAIGELIREYELSELEQRVLAPLNQGGYSMLADRLSYLLGLEAGGEFHSTIRENESVQVVPEETLAAKDRDELDPKDGELVKTCDNLAAFIEAYTALKNGIASDQLHEAVWRIQRHYRKSAMSAGLHIGSLLADFD
jgi:putative hydrolase of HD superfamily